MEWEERPRALHLELVTELSNISYGPFSLVVHLGIFTADSLGLLLCLLQARGLAGLFEKLTEIIGLNRLQGLDQRWALT